MHDDLLNPLLVLIPRQSLDRRALPRRADLPEVNVVAVGPARVGACNGHRFYNISLPAQQSLLTFHEWQVDQSLLELTPLTGKSVLTPEKIHNI